MVATPWGDSEQLRERRLRPVRGTPHDEVERNQRERLFGALVASCAEKGYAATTVADLVEISGVSSRSFYALFGDQHNLARAALEDILDRLQGRLSTSTEPIDEERSRERFELFAAAIVEQPAAARFLLAEAFGAGPETVAALERAIARYEGEVRKRYEATGASRRDPAADHHRTAGRSPRTRPRTAAGRARGRAGRARRRDRRGGDRRPPPAAVAALRGPAETGRAGKPRGHRPRRAGDACLRGDDRRARLRGNHRRGCRQAGGNVGPHLLRELLRQRGPDGERDRQRLRPGDRGHDARPSLVMPSGPWRCGRASGRCSTSSPRARGWRRCSPSASMRPATRRSKRGCAASPRSPR